MAREYFVRIKDGAFAGGGMTESGLAPPEGYYSVLESIIKGSGTVPRNRIRSDGFWRDGAYVEGPSARPMTPEQHAAQPASVDPEFRRQYELLMAEQGG